MSRSVPPLLLVPTYGLHSNGELVSHIEGNHYSTETGPIDGVYQPRPQCQRQRRQAQPITQRVSVNEGVGRASDEARTSKQGLQRSAREELQMLYIHNGRPAAQ